MKLTAKNVYSLLQNSRVKLFGREHNNTEDCNENCDSCDTALANYIGTNPWFTVKDIEEAIQDWMSK